MRPIQKRGKGAVGETLRQASILQCPALYDDKKERDASCSRQLFGSLRGLLGCPTYFVDVVVHGRTPHYIKAVSIRCRRFAPIIDKRWNGHIDRLTGDAARLILSCHLFSTATAVLLTWRYIDVLI
jgi:hypothetical protein